ncbi:hypothetical protein GTY64_31825 [Streptomyces sp. SID8376]|nr:hypothetical protein [Streptomyces sp. McG7]MBT2908209.1 hypothetical protein [Streptomyces sp. McG8]MXQ60456.1 hypothetical protein [Streptomyces sp. XHT-2]MYQ35979.1 hypothetical protein [Streptomyces sp. SID4956]MYW55964.1 hypothetical protein [Streptomyces sp. SID8376]THC58448.1 hypothetical protein E7X38_04785 [Streptomyces sp. Akac8]UVT13808.1 hypothetical protein AY578_04930 [Streptomyces thermocarboxydus]
MFVPPPVEAAVTVPPPQFPDPPIYREMLRTWTDRGRTVPGRHDPEWARLAEPWRGFGRFSASPAPRGGGR